jgi:hypothetical protein
MLEMEKLQVIIEYVILIKSHSFLECQIAFWQDPVT